MRTTYCTTLDDANYFLNQSKGLSNIPSSVPLRERYLRACILFSWIALEEMLGYAAEDLLKRDLIVKVPIGGLWDRIKVILLARGLSAPDQQKFFVIRKIRNLLTHNASNNEVEGYSLTTQQAQEVLDYCTKIIRESYPYNVKVRI